MDITFDTLPQAVGNLATRLDNIERLLQTQSSTTAPAPDDKVLLVKDVAELLHLEPCTIYSMTSLNTIPHTKVGKRCYFSKAEIMEWLKKGKRKTIAETASEADHYCKTKNGGKL